MIRPVRAALLGAAWCLALSGLAGCAGLSPERHRAEALQLGTAAGFTAAVFRAGPFDVFGMLRLRPDGDVLHVFFEGDGAPWPTPYSPPSDPTPAPRVVLPMAIATGGSVAYLARPCQFVAQEGCDARFWTTHRFAPAIVTAYSQILDALQRRSGARRLRLVGYSGGGVIAALLARAREDVVELVTIAAPLDIVAWTAHHDLTPLVGDNPAASPARLATLPQRHLAGGRDKVVPPAVVRRFAERIGRPETVTIEEGNDHECCWVPRAGPAH